MLDEDQPKRGRASEKDAEGERHHSRRHAKRRNKAPDAEMPFQMGAFMQMLPLLLAMGGTSPGQRMIGLQLRLAMVLVEIWIDYLASMQDFLQRTLQRLADAANGGGLFDEEDEEEDEQADW